MKIGILISGRGSNMQALIDAAADPAYPAEIAVVISNRPNVQGLAHAEAAGIPTQVVDHKEFERREDFEAALDTVLSGAGVELVCLAGFMRLLTEWFVDRWWNRLINIHPSLLPAFRGVHVHERVLAYGARFSGCTIHFVRPAMDDGPIIAQAVVPVKADDDIDRLAARVLVQEHRLYPLAVRLIAESRVRVAEDRVVLIDVHVEDSALINPIPA